MINSKELIDQREYAVYKHSMRCWFLAYYNKANNQWDTDEQYIPIEETDECIILPSYD